MDSLLRVLRRRPNAVTFSALTFVMSLAAYALLSHDTLYLLSFLAEVCTAFRVIVCNATGPPLVRCFAAPPTSPCPEDVSGCGLHRRSSARNTAGVSLKTQVLYLVVFLTRLAFKIFYEAVRATPARASNAAGLFVRLHRGTLPGVHRIHRVLHDDHSQGSPPPELFSSDARSPRTRKSTMFSRSGSFW